MALVSESENRQEERSVTPSLILDLDGFAGPLDLLLDLARAQKVDLARISILALVQQYLAVIENARYLRLELAADWLVMAAWLTWLKSRLLLPQDKPQEEEGEDAAHNLAEKLKQLEFIHSTAAWLGTRPLLDHDVFARGKSEDLTEIDRSRLRVSVSGLLSAYLAARRRGTTSAPYQPKPMRFWSVQQALQFLSQQLHITPDWTDLSRFLPDQYSDPLASRAALSSTFMASLELARSGHVLLRQAETFGAIELRRTNPPAAENE